MTELFVDIDLPHFDMACLKAQERIESDDLLRWSTLVFQGYKFENGKNIYKFTVEFLTTEVDK